MQQGSRGLKGLAQRYPLSDTQTLAEAQKKKSRDRLMTRGRGLRSYLKVQLRVPDSFPLEGVGIGGREKSINDHSSLSQFGSVGAIAGPQKDS